MDRRTFLGTVAAGTLIRQPWVRAENGRQLLVSMLTCPRPGGVSYVEETLAAVDTELDERKLLICDGPPGELPLGWTRVLVGPRDRRPGPLPDNKFPGWVALTVAANQGRDLLFLEDDIRPLAGGAFQQMAQHRMPAGVDFTTFYHRMRKPGVYPAAQFEMSQAVLLPYPTVVRLLAAQRRATGDWEAVVGIDLAIASLARGEGMHFEQTPNLIEHVGKISAAMPPR